MKKFIILGACLLSGTGAIAQAPQCPPNGKVVLNNTSNTSLIIGLAANGETTPSAQTICLTAGTAAGIWPATTTTTMEVFAASCASGQQGAWVDTGVNSGFTTNSGYIFNVTSATNGGAASVSCTAPGRTKAMKPKVGTTGAKKTATR